MASNSNQQLDKEDKIKPIGPITQRALAKDYLSENSIPKMFESLIAGLMIERPEDHFQYLDLKLEEIKALGIENVNWESFVSHMHPNKSEVRHQFIHDEIWEKEQERRKLEEFPSDTNQAIEEQEREEKAEGFDKYEPDLFQLTETVE